MYISHATYVCAYVCMHVVCTYVCMHVCMAFEHPMASEHPSVRAPTRASEHPSIRTSERPSVRASEHPGSSEDPSVHPSQRVWLVTAADCTALTHPSRAVASPTCARRPSPAQHARPRCPRRSPCCLPCSGSDSVRKPLYVLRHGTLPPPKASYPCTCVPAPHSLTAAPARARSPSGRLGLNLRAVRRTDVLSSTSRRSL